MICQMKFYGKWGEVFKIGFYVLCVQVDFSGKWGQVIQKDFMSCDYG